MRLKMTAALCLLCLSGGVARAEGPHPNGLVGTTFPADFPRIVDASLGVPVIGFGSREGDVERVPVIFLHGNNDTPFPTACNPFGYIHNLAQFFLDMGYSPRELWGLGYQGDQCDLVATPTNRSAFAHSTEANVPDLRAFVAAVLQYTGARRLDIVGHSLGVTLAREWMRQDHAHHLVRALVAIDGPNHGIISCSPSPLNYFQLPSQGGFTPDSAICREYGSDPRRSSRRSTRIRRRIRPRSISSSSTPTWTSSTSRPRTASSLPCQRRIATAVPTTSRAAPSSRVRCRSG